MADLSSEQLLGLARVARLSIPDQDVEHLTMRFNALLPRRAMGSSTPSR